MDRKHAMRGTAAKTPDEWIALWSGWTQTYAEQLRDALLTGAPFELSVKWGNLLFSHHGTCAVIHVDEDRVVLAFFRGKRLRAIEPAIKASGKFELGNLFFREESVVDHAAIANLAAAAAALNAELGDPTRPSAS